MLEVADVGIDRGEGGGRGQLINVCLKSRMLESMGGSTYKRVLEVADVGIDRGGGGVGVNL